MGLIQVVDENDKLVGHVERADIDYSTQRYRISALWLKNSQGQLLLAQRSKLKDKDPGLWGPSAVGTLDKGETYDENIRKEATEEIGVSNIEFQKQGVLKVDEPRMYYCQWYTAVLDQPEDEFQLQKEEVDQVKWVGTDWLLRDLGEHPGRYVPVMEEAVKLIVGAHK